MREPPPPHLTQLLQRLGLATERDLQNVEANVHRLAGDLPRFQSVWVDALRQAHLLTHFQAAEIMADRGEGLRVGPFVLCDLVQRCGFATVWKAARIETNEPFRLVTFAAHSAAIEPTHRQLEHLAATGKHLPQLSGLVESAGQDGPWFWAASRWIEGTSIGEWMLHHGRFPPEVVLEVARAMAGDLAAMDAAELVHGDVRVENILLLPDGGVCLLEPGLRGIIRPHEGIAHSDLAAEACSTLAPERVAGGSPASVASDLFSCGCVWWQMLCGRPPLGGGDTLSRLRAAQTAAIESFQHWVTDVPTPLAEAVAACLQKDPRKRPASMATLAKSLGPGRLGGRTVIARCLRAAARPHAPWLAAKRAKRAKVKRKHPHALTAATLAMLAVLGAAWPLWVTTHRPRNGASLIAQNTKASESARSDQITASRGPSGDSQQYASAKDSGIVQTVYSEAIPGRPPARGISIDPRDDLILPADKTIPAETLLLTPGQRIRPERNRARVTVGPSGLMVREDRVTFENIDFVPSEGAAESADRERGNPTLLAISAAECTFLGCSFQSSFGRPELSTAIVWLHGTTGHDAAVLPSGRLRMKNCVFRRVAAGIESRARGANTLEIVNSLHMGTGPMIRLTQCLAADEALRIMLSQVTLRESEALVDCRFAGGSEGPVGEISIAATGCVFAPRSDAALVHLLCDSPPQRIFRELKWTGQGSVLTPRVRFGIWQRLGGLAEVVDDATISVSGLVRGEVDFAGRCDGDPNGSRVLECHAPVMESDSIGANTAGLPPEIEKAHVDHP